MSVRERGGGVTHRFSVVGEGPVPALVLTKEGVVHYLRRSLQSGQSSPVLALSSRHRSFSAILRRAIHV